MPKNVLLVDPLVTSRIRLSSVLESGHYAVASIVAAADICHIDFEPDLVVAVLSGDPPAAALRELGVHLDHNDTPFLVLDTDPTPMRRLAALRAGAREVLSRSVPNSLLLARLRALIREGEAERECDRRRMTAASFGLAEPTAAFEPRSTVFTIDPKGELPCLSNMIGAASPHEITGQALSDALASDQVADAYVVASGSDTVVLDGILPELRDRTHSRHAPVMVVCPAGQPDIATRALDLGASELAVDTATGEELALRLERMLARKHMRDALRRSDEQSYRLAATDPLTGLHNRRYAEAYLGDLVMRACEQGLNFVVMLVDLDHFKEVNDGYGHAAGDAVLCEVANRLRENLRACDLIARHGGEEFLVVLPETQAGEAARTAERLRSAVASVPVALGHDRQIRVTASIGVAEGKALARIAAANRLEFATRQTPAMAEVLEAADVALYRAKECGRNRVEFSAA